MLTHVGRDGAAVVKEHGQKFAGKKRRRGNEKSTAVVDNYVSPGCDFV
jgi:hypothetical protein